MKKLMIAVLTGMLSLTATTSFAQTKKETPQEKILRLEIENRVLREEVERLTQALVQARTTSQVKPQSQPQTNSSRSNGGGNSSTTKPKSSVSKKPSYYVDEEVKVACENWETCGPWARSMYNRNNSFVIMQVSFKQTKKRDYIWRYYIDTLTVTYTFNGQTFTKVFNRWSEEGPFTDSDIHYT
ncbi:MAG: hypothetical protein IJ876_00805 [Elusimicrobiaceae bacterium]|nr:hypothetical protein [Elusimicrobiaceae bacterium]